MARVRPDESDGRNTLRYVIRTRVVFTREPSHRYSAQDRTGLDRVGPRLGAHFRHDHRRVHVVGADAVRRQLDAHRPGHLVHGAFGRAVRRVVRDGSLHNENTRLRPTKPFAVLLRSGTLEKRYRRRELLIERMQQRNNCYNHSQIRTCESILCDIVLNDIE